MLINLLSNGVDLSAVRDHTLSLFQDDPVLAALLVFFILSGLVFWVINSSLIFFRTIVIWASSVSRLAVLILFLGFGLFVSMEIVTSINRSLSPRPVFVSAGTIFIGRPIDLKWDYKNPKVDEQSIYYEVESAKNKLFSLDLKPEGFSEVKFLVIDQAVNSSRFWRVRAISGLDNRPLSEWSAAKEIEQYESAYQRIVSTGILTVYTSNSADQGIFRFLKVNRQLGGYDIKLAEAIAAALPAKLGLNSPLRRRFTGVPWVELLDAPREGRADLIISTITSTPERERRFELKFSSPYYCTTQSLVFRANEANPQSLADLMKDHHIGVQAKTTGARLIKDLETGKNGAENVKEYAEAEEVVEALLDPSRPIDVGIIDTPFAASQKMRKRQGGRYLLDFRPVQDADVPQSAADRLNEKYAVGVSSREDKLVEAIDAIIDDLKASGSLQNLLQEAIKDYQSVRHIAGDADKILAGNKMPWECRVQS